MVVVPKFESDISRILQISNIVGVPISVRSEGRSYNLCKSVKPSKYEVLISIEVEMCIKIF